MTDDTIFAAKRRISSKFLGKAGIHGVGLAPEARDTITVHRSAPVAATTRAAAAPDADAEAVIEEIRREARPFKIEVQEDDAPVVQPGAQTRAGD